MPLYRLEPMEKKEWRNYQRFYKGDDFEFTTVELYRFGYVTIEHDGDMQNFFESYCDGLFEVKDGIGYITPDEFDTCEAIFNDWYDKENIDECGFHVEECLGCKANEIEDWIISVDFDWEEKVRDKYNSDVLSIKCNGKMRIMEVPAEGNAPKLWWEEISN